jgi:hypothetical protein
MGSSASVWLLNVAVFLGAEYLGGALGGHWGNPVAARLRQRVHLGEPRMCPCRGA